MFLEGNLNNAFVVAPTGATNILTNHVSLFEACKSMAHFLSAAICPSDMNREESPKIRNHYKNPLDQ